MLNISEEYNSLLKLIIQKYQILQRINPKEKLLTLLKYLKENEFTITEEFLNKYYCEDKKECIHPSLDVFGHYYLHLESAISKELNKNGHAKNLENYHVF